MERRFSIYLAMSLIVLFGLYSFVFYFIAQNAGVFFSPPVNEPGTCTDNDGGISPSTKGTLVSENYNYGQAITLADFCLNSSNVVDYSCFSNGTFGANVFACRYGCNDGACINDRYSYLLSPENFLRLNGIPAVSIRDSVADSILCADKKAGDLCQIGITYVNITNVYVSNDNVHKAVQLDSDFSGRPFGAVFDNLKNRIYLPLKSELPASSVNINVIDSDGDLVQPYTFSWGSNSISINAGSLSQYKSHNFAFEVVDGDKLKVSFPSTNGNVELYLLYGDGTSFTGIGQNSSNKLAATYADGFLFNKTDGDQWFSLYWSKAGTNLTCYSNFTAKIGQCLPGERNEKYFTSSNTCGISLPENQTFERCDYDNNRVIGFVSDIDSNFNASLYDNGFAANLSRNFSGEHEISINEGGDKRVEFTFDFDEDVLDLTEIFLRRQNNSEGFGYVIVNGLDNLNKSAYVDKLANQSNSVCIKNRDIQDIDEFSNRCTSNSEEVVLCNGIGDEEYVCTDFGSYYLVSGLSDSAVKEFFYQGYTGNGSSNCIPSWSCGEWEECAGGQQIRICEDVNSCGSSSGKPSEVKECGESSVQQSSQNGQELNPAGSASIGAQIYFWMIIMIILVCIAIVIILIALNIKNKRKLAEQFFLG